MKWLHMLVTFCTKMSDAYRHKQREAERLELYFQRNRTPPHVHYDDPGVRKAEH